MSLAAEAATVPAWRASTLVVCFASHPPGKNSTFFTQHITGAKDVMRVQQPALFCTYICSVGVFTSIPLCLVEESVSEMNFQVFLHVSWCMRCFCSVSLGQGYFPV